MQTVYSYHPVFRRGPRWRELAPGQRQQAAAEAEALLMAPESPIQVRGIYSGVGFRPDADLMMWWVGPSADAVQSLLVAFQRTLLGQHLELTWAFLGLHRPPEFNPDHLPAFLRGEPPRRYLCVYPFVRTAEWYLLPPDERARLLREHGELGRRFPQVLTNTTQGFGLGDYEWILAFETDELDKLVDCIRTLRSAEARRYTRLEVPFILGIRKGLEEAVADLA
ncbi:MAG: hydrogen peroxide-dependent heme synthase [Chloroflexota bacterium]|jgi:chlorite dismutase|nr:hydrogen peroxide-dependent heme synthase [Chloroflexota bacterium]